MTTRAVYRMRPLEIAVGWVPGHVTAPFMISGAGREPRDALDDILRSALLRAPCVVAFSGGRDSSVILAAATAVARREGLADPIPVTRWHPGLKAADEESWQRRVVDHLQLVQWHRVRLDGQLDLIGPYARRVLKRHGLVWPSAAHAMLPVMDAAGEGTVLTGEGGDEVFGVHRITPLSRIRAGDRSRAALREAAVAFAPSRLRAAATTRRLDQVLPTWLRPVARDAVRPLLVADEVDGPLRLRASLRRLLSRRAWVVGRATLDQLADDAGVACRHPFMEPSFVGAVADVSAPLGFPDRTTALETLFADLLPGDVLRRQSKAVFNAALFHDDARAFAASWDGDGIDHDLVDADRLRVEWVGDHPSALSGPLLQVAWLDDSQTHPAAGP